MVPQWKHKFGIPEYAGAEANYMEIDDSSNTFIFEDVINYGWNRTTNIDPILRKLNKNGEQLWIKNFGVVPEIEEHPYGMKIAKNGYLYLLYSQAYIGNVLTKIDLNGNIIWKEY